MPPINLALPNSLLKPVCDRYCLIKHIGFVFLTFFALEEFTNWTSIMLQSEIEEIGDKNRSCNQHVVFQSFCYSALTIM